MHYGIEKINDKEEFWVTNNSWVVIKRCEAFNSIGDYTSEIIKFIDDNRLTIETFEEKRNLGSVVDAYKAELEKSKSKSKWNNRSYSHFDDNDLFDSPFTWQF